MGDTVSVVSWFSRTGSEPYSRAMARFWASAWVKDPEICTWPLNDDHASWVGWVIGADWTTPSSSMPMISWKYRLVMASQPWEPEPVNVMSTAH